MKKRRQINCTLILRSLVLILIADNSIFRGKSCAFLKQTHVAAKKALLVTSQRQISSYSFNLGLCEVSEGNGAF